MNVTKYRETKGLVTRRSVTLINGDQEKVSKCDLPVVVESRQMNTEFFDAGAMSIGMHIPKIIILSSGKPYKAVGRY